VTLPFKTKLVYEPSRNNKNPLGSFWLGWAIQSRDADRMQQPLYAQNKSSFLPMLITTSYLWSTQVKDHNKISCGDSIYSYNNIFRSLYSDFFLLKF